MARVHGDALLFARLRREVCCMLAVLCDLPGKDDVVTVRPEDVRQRRYVELLGGLDQRVRRLVGSCEQLRATGRRGRGGGTRLRDGLLSRNNWRTGQAGKCYRARNPKETIGSRR